MKKKTYHMLKRIPFGKLALFVTGNTEIKICSQMMADGLYEPIRKYAKLHPDTVITEKLAKRSFQKVKQCSLETALVRSLFFVPIFRR